jgi:hypothetical protein
MRYAGCLQAVLRGLVVRPPSAPVKTACQLQRRRVPYITRGKHESLSAEHTTLYGHVTDAFQG